MPIAANEHGVDWSTIAAVEAMPGIIRQQIDTALLSLIRYVYQPGSVFPAHSHPEEQVTIVQSGQIEFDIDGQIALLRSPDVAIIPGDTVHGARVISDETVETINILTPRRRHNPRIGDDQPASNFL